MAVTYEDFLKTQKQFQAPETVAPEATQTGNPAALVETSEQPQTELTHPAAPERPAVDPELTDAYQRLLQSEQEEEFKNRGFVRSLAGDVAGGLVDYGKLALGATRALTPVEEPGKETGFRRTLTEGMEGIERYKQEHPFLLEDPNEGFLGQAVHGGIRSAVQSVASGVPSAVAGAVAGAAVTGPAAPVGAMIGAVVGFASGAAIQFGLNQYDDVMERGMKELMKKNPGMTWEEARDEVQPSAIRQGIYEGGFEFAQDLLEGWTMGGSKLFTAPAKKAAMLAVKDLTKTSMAELAKRTAGVTAIEAGGEMLTSGFEAEEDRRLGIGSQTFWDGAKEAFGPSVVASLIFAGLGHANLKLAQRGYIKALENPNAKPELRQQAVEEVHAGLWEQDPLIADVWAKNANEAIARGEAISTKDDVLGLQQRVHELSQETNPTPEQQQELIVTREQLRKLYAGEDQKPLPADRAGLEEERAYWEQYGQNFPAENVDQEAIAKRQAQIDTALKEHDVRDARIADLESRIEKLSKVPKPTKKMQENLARYQEELAAFKGQTGTEEEQPSATGIQIETPEPTPVVPEKTAEELKAEIDQGAHEASTSPQNELSEPTEGQKEAGNYKVGPIKFQGMDISVENPEGSVRAGTDAEGNPWQTKMQNHYGYLKGTVGKDKDHLDTFIGNNPKSDKVFVVDQKDPKTGKFDEHKIMLGFDSREEAQQAYHDHYQPSWQGEGAITEMSTDEFKKWAYYPSKTKKPLAYQEGTNDRAGEEGIHGEVGGRNQEPGGAVSQPGGGPAPAGTGGVVQGQEGEGITIEEQGAGGTRGPRGPKLSGDLAAALDEAANNVDKITEAPSTTKEIAEEKAHVKGVVHREVAAGTIPVGSAVRATDIEELKHILEKKQLREGQSFEGRPGISATEITTMNKPPLPMYGGFEHIPVGIIASKEHIIGRGESANEVLLDPKTDVTQLRFAIDKHNDLYSFEQLPGVLEEIAKENGEGGGISTETPANVVESTLDKWEASERKESEGSWEGSIISTQREKWLKPLLEKLQKNPWSGTADLVTGPYAKINGGRSRVADALQKFKDLGLVDIRWTPEGEPRWAFAGVEEKPGLLTEEQINAMEEGEKQGEAAAPETKGAADQLDEMSIDQIDNLIDEVAAEKEAEEKAGAETPAGIPVETPAETPAETGGGEAPVGGPRTPRGPKTTQETTPKQPKERTASEIIQSAAGHGVKGIENIANGLYELFGGKALKSLPGGIDEETYAKAKPYFEEGLKQFQEAGKDAKAFIRWVIDSFSRKIAPYLKRWLRERKGVQEGTQPGAEGEGLTVGEGGKGLGEGGEGITIESEEEEGSKKGKGKGGKKRGPKLQDTGEKLGGKRSSVDHSVRTEAILIELNDDSATHGTPEQIVKALLKKTSRSDILKVEHNVEGRTPGTKRFLEAFRAKTATWQEAYANQVGGRWGAKDADKIKDHIEKSDENQIAAKKSAAAYIAVFERINDAVSAAANVTEVRQNLLKLFFGEEKAQRWASIENMRQDVSSLYSLFGESGGHTNEIGKAFSEFLVKRYDIADFLRSGWQNYVAKEDEETRNLRIERQRRNIFEIETPDEYRNGRDVTPQELLDAFGLRGLDFGEWVEADFRQRSVNLTYDSFKMLAEALGANDKGISLNENQRLGIGWGARGRGGRAAAEFYPTNSVIALTKTKGDGSLSHEWAHAFDYMTLPSNMEAEYEGRQVNAIDDLKLALKTFYKTEGLEDKVMDLLRGMWSSGRNRMGRLEEARRFLKEDAINDIKTRTQFYYNAIQLDHGVAGEYWSKSEEMFARAFEAFLSDKLQGANTYLVDKDFVAPGGIENLFNRDHGGYPTDVERQRFQQIMDDFFSQIEWNEEGVPTLKKDYVPVTTRERLRAEKAIEELHSRIESIYEALYGGELSEDGLYWYAFEQTSRANMAQPKGYMAYDDAYKLEEEDLLGKGAVGYSEKLKASEVLMYFLRPIKYNGDESTIRLEVPDGTITDLGSTGNLELEAESPEHGQTPSGEGTAEEGGDRGTGTGDRGSLGPDGSGNRPGNGEGNSAAEDDLSAHGGGNADTSSGLDAIQSTQKLDYEIRTSEELEQTNLTERFNNNIAAIRTLKLIEAEGRMATAEEQALLVKYNGWGELSEALSRYPDDKWKGRAEMIQALLTPDELREMRRSALDAYYTPPTVAHGLWEGLQRLGFAGGKILEPSCGIGHLFGTMPPDIRRNSILTGIEMDGVTARIAAQLYQTGNVINQSFEETSVPDNFYDLAISNVPYGDTEPYDKKHNPGNFPIHDYFINKMINITKPGGLIAVLTSTGTMDKGSEKARKQWNTKVDMVGAIRLPNGIFPGAYAGADILIMRKKGEGFLPVPAVASWAEVNSFQARLVDSNGIAVPGYSEMSGQINNYFAANPENIIGELRLSRGKYGNITNYVQKQSDFKEKLREVIDRLPVSIYETSRNPIEIDMSTLIPDANHVKDFSYYIGDDGNIYRSIGGRPELQEFTPEEAVKVRGLLGMRGTARNLLRAQAMDLEASRIDNLRALLNQQYDAFVRVHGPINLRKNKRLIIQDPDAGLLLSLEHWDADAQQVKKKALIFTKNTIARVQPPTSADTSEEALVHSLAWRGRIDLPWMAKLTGKTQDVLVNELKGKVFDDPELGHVTADEYLSGNVRKKLAIAKSAAELDPKYKENVEALEIALPVDIPMNEIRAKLGASWVPAHVVVDFVNELFGGGLNGFKLDHVIETGQWTSYFTHRTKAQATRNQRNAMNHTVATDEYGTRRVNFFDTGREKGILNYALNGGFPQVYDERRVTDAEGRTQIVRILNVQATDAANAKLAALHARFSAWVLQRDTAAETLSKAYNERFNSFVERKYDGSHLTFPGKVPDELIKLRPHQKAAIWRYLQSGVAYFAHEVGTGKTFSMIGSTMEARRMGLTRKPVMVVKKATLGQIAADFLRLYPGANILTLTVPENAQQRRLVLNRIATGDFDAVIMNHNSFERIPVSPETQAEIINREIERLTRAQIAADRAGAARHTLRDIERKIEALRQKMRKAMDIERDNVPTMEEMGIDMIVVDEAHTHKNIGFATQYAGLKGVDPTQSAIAFDLFVKTQYIHNRYGRGILMASGTPLTNSVGELYNLSRYLHPQMLDQLGVSTFDAWANTFGLMRREAEYSPEGGGFKLRSRFAEFINVPELMAISRQNMDIKMAKDIGIVRPGLTGGKPEAVTVEQNPYVKAFQKLLKRRLQNIRTNGRNAMFRGVQDNMLRLVTDGRLVAMDPRLYNPQAEDYADTKTNVAVEKIWELYRKPVDAIERDPTSPNYDKPYKEKKHLQLVFADRGVPRGEDRFNLYADIKRKLVAKGIPAKEIAFIHDVGNNDQKRAELFRKAQAGDIRVLIGSTGLMGIGVNVQNRVSNMHHLDVDWTYANYEQRNGRGWRFGNNVKEVGIFNYGTKKTVDAFMWSTVAFKERVLQQILSNDPKIRNVIDISQTSMDASEMEGILADDPLHKEKIELEDDVRRLSNIYSEYESSRYRARDKLARNPLEKAAAEKAIANNQVHLEIAEGLSALQVGPIGEDNERAVTDKTFDLEKDGGKANTIVSTMIKKTKWPAGQLQLVIGRFGRIDTQETTVKTTDPKTNKEVEKTEKVKRFVPLDGTLWAVRDPENKERPVSIVYKVGSDVKYSYDIAKGIKHGLTNIVHGLKSNIEEKQKNIQLLEAEAPRLQKLIDTPFEQQEELVQKERRLREVTDILLQRQADEEARLRAEMQGGPGQEGIDIEDEDDVVLFSAGQPARAAVSDVTGTHEAITPIIEKWKDSPVEVHLVRSANELPNHVKEEWGDKIDRMEAAYDPRSKTVWMVSDNIVSGDRAQEVLLHEIHGHYGLEGLLGQRFRRFVNEVIALHGKEGLREVAEDYGLDLNKYDHRYLAARELLARMAERGEKPKFIERIIAAVRDQLRRLGFTIKLTDADIKAMIARAGEWAEKGARAENIREQAKQDEPETVLSLSPKALVDQLQGMIVKAPKEELDVTFGEGNDLREFRDSLRLTAWLGKTNNVVKQFFNRQNERDKQRSTMYHDLLQETAAVYDLKEKDADDLAALAFRLENNKVAEAYRYKKVGTREITRGREVITLPVYALNDEHYQQLENHLRKKEKVSEPVIAAYLQARRALDQTVLATLDRLAEMRNMDPTLIEEFRNKMGRIENYWPHARYGNWYLKAVDPNAKPGEETKYRQHFNSSGRRYAQYWYSKNIDQIIADLEKKDPDTNWKSLQWTVDKIKNLPEEIYDFPLPVDAIQKVIDAACDKMPEAEGVKESLRRELSQEVSNVLKSRGFGSHMIGRKDIPGFETKDVGRVLHDHFSGFTGWMTKMSAAHDFGLMLRDIDAKNKPNEYKWAVRYVHDMLQNQTSLDRTVDNARTFFFLKYLGLNLKTAAVNLTQNVIAGIPRLAMDVGLKDSSMAFGKAIKDLRLSLTEEGIKGTVETRITAREKRFLQDMFAEGWGQSQFVNEVRGKLGSKYKQVFGKVVRVMGLPMEVAERYNRLSLGLAAFRAASEGKITNEQVLARLQISAGQKADFATAKRFAEGVVNDAHFIYTKGNRPQVIRGTATGKVLSTAYTFRSFSHNLLSMWRWMLMGGDPEGKKAFAYSLLAVLSLGGLVAAPAYNTLASLIRQLFGEDLLGSGVRNTLPPGMRDLVMYGAPALVGVNIGGSLGMEVPVLDKAKVNQPMAEQLGGSMGELLGIPYAVFDEITSAIDAIRAGRSDRATEMVAPMFIRNVMSGYRLATEGQTTLSGTPINVPGERYPRRLTAAEGTVKALGFQPTSSTKAFEIYQSLEQLKEFRNEKQQELANRFMKARLDGDQKEMVAVRNEAREWNRAAVVSGKREMKIDLEAAIEARRKVRQPMKQLRGVARELRESYGM